MDEAISKRGILKLYYSIEKGIYWWKNQSFSRY
jgi:hypothetical protein